MAAREFSTTEIVLRMRNIVDYTVLHREVSKYELWMVRHGYNSCAMFLYTFCMNFFLLLLSCGGTATLVGPDSKLTGTETGSAKV